MGSNSKIEWCMHTFQPWEGCAKVSEGCKYCYALTRDQQYHDGKHWGPTAARKPMSEQYWKQPAKWSKEHWYFCEHCNYEFEEKDGIYAPILLCPKCEDDDNLVSIRTRVFCASLADVFEERQDLPMLDDLRVRLFRLIINNPRLDFLLLTKRPENVNLMIERATGFSDAHMWFHAARNVIMGTSIENQETAVTRTVDLLKIPAKRHFVSCEPLLDFVDLTNIELNSGRILNALTGVISRQTRSGEIIPASVGLIDNHINMVIVGGESGVKARPMNPDHAISLRDQCNSFNVPFFFKQWGEWLPDGYFDSFVGDPIKGRVPVHPRGEHVYYRVGKKKAGHRLGGRIYREFPDDIR